MEGGESMETSERRGEKAKIKRKLKRGVKEKVIGRKGQRDEERSRE